MDGATLIGVDKTERGITLTPTKNDGPRRGFDDMNDRAVFIHPQNDAELGTAVITALQLSE